MRELLPANDIHGLGESMPSLANVKKCENASRMRRRFPASVSNALAAEPIWADWNVHYADSGCESIMELSMPCRQTVPHILHASLTTMSA
jgi:hypothetical protein